MIHKCQSLINPGLVHHYNRGLAANDEKMKISQNQYMVVHTQLYYFQGRLNKRLESQCMGKNHIPKRLSAFFGLFSTSTSIPGLYYITFLNKAWAVKVNKKNVCLHYMRQPQKIFFDEKSFQTENMYIIFVNQYDGIRI